MDNVKMPQDKKLILLEDLSGRTPYGVMLKTDNVFPQKLEGISFDNDTFLVWVSDGGFTLENMECKPYLFPLSSITEEIMDEIYEASGVYDIGTDSPIHIEVGTTFEDLTKIFHILNKHHIDYRGLIPMGLALDATGLGIYP